MIFIQGEHLGAFYSRCISIITPVVPALKKYCTWSSLEVSAYWDLQSQSSTIHLRICV